MNWYALKSKCIDQVAREIARPRVIAMRLPVSEQLAAWANLQKDAEPEAIEQINAMSNMALLDLIAETVGRET